MTPPTESEDEVSKTLRLLQTNPSVFCGEDTQLLVDLTDQFYHFCDNFRYGKQNTRKSNEDVLLSHSLVYLQNLGTPKPSDKWPATEQDSITQLEEVHNQIELFWIDGQKRYFMDGKQIHFKVLKNKPKNGEFRVRWNRNYEQLKEFKEHYGHLHVTRSTTGHEELGNWIAEQRRKLKRGKITLEQFETLSSLGFEWDRSHYFHKTFQEKKKVL